MKTINSFQFKGKKSKFEFNWSLSDSVNLINELSDEGSWTEGRVEVEEYECNELADEKEGEISKQQSTFQAK